MFKTTRITCITISTFLVGILIGATALAYLLITKVPMPIVPHLLSASTSLTPACIAVLAASLVWKPLQIAVAPIVGLAGLAVPFDFAFACLLGLFDDAVLRAIVVLLFLSAAAMLFAILGSLPPRQVHPGTLKNLPSTKIQPPVTGAGQ